MELMKWQAHFKVIPDIVSSIGGFDSSLKSPLLSIKSYIP